MIQNEYNPALGAAVTHFYDFYEAMPIGEGKTVKLGRLYRATDGMQIGGWQDVTVIWGENPNKNEARVFRDSFFAEQYLLNVIASEDLTKNPQDGKKLNVEHVAKTGKVIIPDINDFGIATAGPGSMRRMRN